MACSKEHLSTVVKLKEWCVTFNIKKEKEEINRKKMPFTLLPFTSSIDCKNKIDSFLKNANCMENNIEHLYPLVNEFFKYLRNILQISFWLKDIDNSRIDSLYSHFMKYAFKDKQLDCIQNFTFLKNDLDHFWKEYLTLYMNFRAHIESLGFLFSVERQFEFSDHVLITTGDSYSDSIKHLEEKTKEMKSLADSLALGLGKFNDFSNLKDLYVRYAFTLTELSDTMIQISFLANADCLTSDGFGPPYFVLGNIIKKMLHIERLSLLPSNNKEIINLISDVLQLQEFKEMLNAFSTQLVEVCDYLKKGQQFNTYECVSKIRRNMQKHICCVNPTQQVSINDIVKEYMKECSVIIGMGKVYWENCYKFLYMNKEDKLKNPDFSAIFDRFHRIIRQSRLFNVRQSVNHLLDIAKHPLNNKDQNLLISLATRCKQKHHLHLLSTGLSEIKLQDTDIIVGHVDHLKTILASVHEVLNCAHNPQQRKNSFEGLVCSYVQILLNPDLGNNDMFLEHVEAFAKTMSSDLDLFLIETAAHFGKEQDFYKQLEQFFPSNKLKTWQDVELYFLFKTDMFKIDELGVEICFLQHSSKPFNIRNVQAIRLSHDGYKVARCSFKIPKNCCKSLLYRYTINRDPEMLSITKSGELDNVQDCYRVLNLSAKSCEGSIQVYDSPIHKRIPKKDLIKWFMNKIGYKIEFELPDRKNELQLTLKCHLLNGLDELKNASICYFEEADQLYRKLCSTIKSLETAQVYNISQRKDLLLHQDDISEEVRKLFFDVIATLKDSNSPQRVISTLIIGSCLVNSLKNYAATINQLIPELLATFYPVITNEGSCQEYEAVMTTFHDKGCRQKFMNDFKTLLFIHLKERGHIISVKILKSMPFLNWFCGSSQTVPPFSTMPVSLKELKEFYCAALSNLPNVSTLSISCEDVEEVAKNHHHLFEADILLQFILVQACPNGKHHCLFQIVQLPIILVSLGQQLVKKSKPLHAVLQIVLKNKESLLPLQFKDLIVDILLSILHDMKLQKDMNMLKDLFLISTQVLIYYDTRKVKLLIPFIQWWVKKEFSEFIGEGSDKQWKNEQKFWTDLHQVGNQSIEWNNVLHDLISSRCKKDASSDQKLNLLICLEKSDSQSIAFTTINKTVEVDVEKMMRSSQPLTPKIMKYFEQSHALRLILCKKVEEMFSESTIDFNSILTWKFWPVVLNAIRQRDPNAVNAKCVTFSTVISNMLNDSIAIRLQEEDFTVIELNEIKENWSSQLVKVINALKMNEEIFSDSLRKCVLKVELFELFLKLMDTFLSSKIIGHLKDVLSDIKRDFGMLENDYKKNTIKTLCQQVEDDSYVFPCFDEARKFVPILIPFAVLISKCFDNDIFRHFWKQFLQQRREIEVDEIIPQIWTPTIDSCIDILWTLEHEHITISEAKRMFGSKERSDNEHSIQKLVSAFKVIDALGWTELRKNLPTNNSSIESVISSHDASHAQKPHWIPSISKKINEWSSVDKLMDSADFVCKVIEGLEIILLENEQEMLQIFSSMNFHDLETKMIKDMTPELSLLKDNLEKIKSNVPTQVLSIIELFCEHSELWKWIQEKSQSLYEMEKFISIAIGAVAGEGHVVQDRLSDLRVVCSKFSVLLYNLPHHDESERIVKVMNCICKCAEKLRGFDAKLLKECLNNLPWYMSQGELQGSVEKGAVKDLEDINNYGQYTIQICEDSKLYTITLKVSSEDEMVTNKEWELSELQELESKLVLITRETAEWVDSKDIFQNILQQVIRMTDMLQRMKDYGHQRYLNNKIEILCHTYISETDFKKLVEKSNQLENELCSWINHVWHCRQKYYHLNFYTNQQLVILKNEIESLEKDANAVAGSQLFNLLYSITGRFIRSSFLIRRILRGDESAHLDIEDCSSDDGILSEQTSNSSAQESMDLDLTVPEDSDDATLDKAIAELNEEQKTIFTELVDMDYDKELAYEAVIQEEITDVYNATEWCDDKALDDEFIETLQQKWQIGQSTDIEIEDNSVLISCHSEEANLEYDLSEIGQVFAPFHYTNHNKMSSALFKESDSFENLGKFLQNFAKSDIAQSMDKRQFPEYFECGQPNLVIVDPEDVFLTVLQIYYEDRERLLPRFEEVLLCSIETTLEEVGVFLMRAMHDPKPSNIYCIVHAEKLKYVVAEKAMDLIDMFSQGRSSYRLIVVCSSETEQKSITISRLQAYRRKMPEINHKGLQKYARYHLINDKSTQKKVFASKVDADNCRVRLVSSQTSGVGKTLYVRRMKEKLVKLLLGNKSRQTIATVPLHGPIVTVNEVLSMLLDSQENLRSSIIHLDIPQKVLRFIDDILFSLIFLQGLCNTDGQIWRCLPSQYYLIETVIPNENHYLNNFSETKRVLSVLNLLPNVECIKPGEILRKNITMLDEDKVGIDKIEMCTPMYQRVYQYLQKIDDEEDLESFKYVGTLEGTEETCLQMIIKHCGVDKPTWKEIRHFVWFLNVQLSACEQSNLLPKWKGLKSFVANFMIKMSKDFATSSISSIEDGNGDTFTHHQITKSWEQSMHPYLFFNKNRTSVTHVGMHISTTSRSTCLKDNYKNEEIDVVASQEIIKFLEDVARVPRQHSKSEDHDSSVLIQCLADFFNIKIPDNKSPDTGYVLTQDNLTKIMGIQMRFRCRIPVVLMGETGCGKTHLIRFMCQFARYNNPEIQNMFILKVHGGTTVSEVIDCIKVAEKNALINRKNGIETVVFFDEANTSEVISLIKEIMCDGRCRGKSVPPFLKFIAACNPYRQHEKVMKDKLKNAGLGWKETDSNERLGEIPMRDLVYRVLELPASMRALVYDFGGLSDNIEQQYIYEIVKNRIYDCGKIQELYIIGDIAAVFNSCQDFMRQSKDECSFVSLRDVERAAIVFNYFYDKFFDIFKIDDKYGKLDSSLILTISVCYHSRIENRDLFEKEITKKMSNTRSFSYVNHKDFKILISNYQLNLLNCMTLHQNIARNAALRENVFMMVICIELRIPLFLVGKPGSSKSLAKSIVSNSMHGEESTNDKLKEFKKVNLCSHQCSPLSTPASIIEVFHKAKSEQDREGDVDKSVSVVVLDEVGLAEASPHLPLKALHPLLEDGTEGSSKTDKKNDTGVASFTDSRFERSERVAFIGISNWALDPAKMNRGIMVTRGDPGIIELTESAKGICNSEEQNSASKRLESLFDSFSKAYNEISKNQKRQFFGLRDFYSLIKMLYWMTNKSETKLTKAQLLHAIKRNFDGYDSTELDPVKKFQEALTPSEYDFDGENGDLVSLKSLSGNYLTVQDNDTLVWKEACSREAQFIVSLTRHKKSKVFQSLTMKDKYLGFEQKTDELILTGMQVSIEIEPHKEVKGFVSLNSINGRLSFDEEDIFSLVKPIDPDTNPDCSHLGLIKASLQTKETSWHGESRYLLFLTENYSALQTLKQYIITTTETSSTDGEFNEPFVLFGSSFPKDNEYSQVCRNISEVRLCMETGRMVILLNLENLYESLYDVLNQYYTETGGHRYVDLGLRTNRMKCRVHEDFKLILIAEKTKVYEDFPIPLVNRMEKHFVSSKTVLNESQIQLCDKLEKWIERVTGTDGQSSNFRVEDVFIGYNSDTVAAVVLQASSKSLIHGSTMESPTNDQIVEVFEISKFMLLQLATPDGICRYMSTKHSDKDEVVEAYFIEQEHSSLSNLFNRLGSNRNGQLIQVTSHSHTLSQKDISVFGNQLGCDDHDIVRLHLESFHTEQDFINSVRNALERGSDHSSESQSILLLECDSGHNNGNLISCCRYRIVDILNDDENLRNSNTCILFLIHIPRKYPKSTFVSFQELPWHCYHVDELITEHSSMQLSDVVLANNSVSEIFSSDISDSKQYSSTEYIGKISKTHSLMLFLQLRNIQKKDLHYSEQLHDLVPEAISACSIRPDRIGILQSKISQQSIDEGITLYKDIVCLMKKSLDLEAHQNKDWVLEEALNLDRLEETGSFRKALIEKLKRIVLPALANVLSFIDQYNNLDTLEDGNDHQKEAWIILFRNNMQYFTNNVDHAKSITCEFPFSWVVYNEFCKAMTDNGNYTDGELKKTLNQVPVDLLDHYLNDFVQLCYKCHSHKDSIHEVIVLVTLNMMHEIEVNSESLFDLIMKIHLIHKINARCFSWFCKLASQVSSILQDTTCYHSMNIECAVSLAVDKTLSSPYFDLHEPFVKGKAALRGWIQKLYGMQSMIESILKFSSSNKTRLTWKWICIRRMFVEHIVLKNEEEMLFVMKRIETKSERKEEFDNTLNILVTFLTAIELGLQKGKVKNQGNRNAIHESCWMLFKEALVVFCFDSDDATSSVDTLSNLVDAVFTNEASKIGQFIKFHKDKNVALQIWMLKSICTHMHIDRYSQSHLEKILSLVEDLSHSNVNLIGFNDSICTTTLSLCSSFNLQSAASQNTLLANGISDFEQHRVQPMSPSCLKAIAQIHHSCQALAEAIHKLSENNEDDVNEDDVKYFSDMILSQELNDDVSFTGPYWYLLRLIARMYGLSTLIKSSKIPVFDWIMDHEIFEKETEMWHYLDPAAIYNPTYEQLRSEVSEVLSGSSSTLLDPKSLHSQQAIPLVLAIYERIRQNYVCSQLPSKRIGKTDVLTKLVSECKIYKPHPEIVQLIKSVASNTHCKQVPQMVFRPEESHDDYITRTLIIHAVTTLIISKTNKVTKLLSDILLRPKDFKTSSMLPTVHSVGTNKHCPFLKYPECMNSHKHSSMMINQQCPSCGTKVQQIKQEPVDYNNPTMSIVMCDNIVECTESKLGFLSPVSYGIIRCILYSCLLWSSCHNKDINMIRLKPSVDSPALYFWDKIKACITLVHEGTGRSIDDAVMIVHMVIQEIAEFGQVLSHGVDPETVVKSITSVDHHRQWELQFERLFINPVLNNVSEKMNQLYEKLTDRDHNRLFSSLYLYEKLPNCASDVLQWQYHPSVTMNHFLLNNINMEWENNHPTLFYMIAEIDSIEATKFIGDIVHLMRNIHDIVMQKYSLKNKQELETMEFQEFVYQHIPENDVMDFNTKFANLCEAWKMTRSSIYTRNHFKLAEGFKVLNLNKTTKMSHFIPAMKDDGLLTIALLDHLIWTHNCVVQRSRHFVKTTLEREWLFNAREVHIMDFHSSDYIDYKENLFQFVIKHSTYQFQSGNPYIKYDLIGLEKDLVCQCVLDKRVILGHTDVPQVVWEMNSTILAMSIVEQKFPQKDLPRQAGVDIINELKTVAQLSDVIKQLESALKILKNEEPRELGRRLKSYMERVQLPLNSVIAGQHCQLENIKYLWKLLCIEKEKLHCRNNETPFTNTNKKYLNKITKEQSSRLSESLRKISNLEQNMIWPLFDFIQLVMKYRDHDEEFYKALSAFQAEREQEIAGYKDVFVTEFKVCHAVDVWRHIVLYQDKVNKKNYKN